MLNAFSFLLFVIVMIGPVSVLAPAGMTVITIMAGLIAFFVLNGMEGLKELASSRFLPVFVLFCLLGSLSSFWALDPGRALTQSVKITLLCLLGLASVAAVIKLAAEKQDQLERATLLSTFLSIGLLMTGLLYAKVTGQALWGNYSNDPLTTLSRGQAVLVLMIWPAAAILLRKRGWPLTIAMFAGVGVLFLFLANTTVLLSMFAGCVVYFAVRLFGPSVHKIIAVVFVSGILLAPAIVQFLPSGEVLFNKVGSVYPTAVHRVYIWHFATDRIFDHPIKGWGLDASRSIPGGSENLDLDPFSIWNVELMPLHPHNSALQVWLELGLMGALLMAWLVWMVLTLTGRRTGAPFLAATATTYLIIGGLSYGVWQSWWIATGWVAASLIAANTEDGEGDALEVS
jgi:O-antigen ligase